MTIPKHSMMGTAACSAWISTPRESHAAAQARETTLASAVAPPNTKTLDGHDGKAATNAWCDAMFPEMLVP